MNDIEARVRAVVADQLGVDESDVTLESGFVQDLGADSLDLVELAMALEDEFGINISDDDFERLRRARDVVGYLEQRFVRPVFVGSREPSK